MNLTSTFHNTPSKIKTMEYRIKPLPVYLKAPGHHTVLVLYGQDVETVLHQACIDADLLIIGL